MAIINTYPSATPKGADLLIGTQVKDDTVLENSTKSFAISAIGSFLITSNDIVTGSGTTDQVLKFTDGPNGVVGDSFIKSYVFSPGTGSEENRVEINPTPGPNPNVLIVNTGEFTTVKTDSIIASDTGSVTMNGNVTIGNSSTDELNITSTTNIWNAPVKSGPTALGALAPGAGYVLVSTASSTLEWKSQGTGTTDTLPVWTDGPNGVLGDSLITQTTSPDVVTIGSRFIVSPNSILALDISQGAGKAIVTISDNLKVDGTYYDSASDQGTDGDVLLAKGTPGNMATRWTSLANAGITSGIETAQVTITDAQIRTLGTVPVEIIPSTTNASIQIIGLTIQDIGNGALGSAYDWSSSGDGVFYGQAPTPTQHRVEIPNSYLPTGGPSFTPDIYVASITPGGMKADASIRMSTTTGVDPSIPIGQSPSGEMIVNVTYRIIPIT